MCVCGCRIFWRTLPMRGVPLTTSGALLVCTVSQCCGTCSGESMVTLVIQYFAHWMLVRLSCIYLLVGLPYTVYGPIALKVSLLSICCSFSLPFSLSLSLSHTHTHTHTHTYTHTKHTHTHTKHTYIHAHTHTCSCSEVYPHPSGPGRDSERYSNICSGPRAPEPEREPNTWGPCHKCQH